MLRLTSLDDLHAHAGYELGVSGWLVVDQDRIDAFAEVTGDRQWIHVDADRALDGPFGATVAHGFLTLSLIPELAAEVYEISGAEAIVNYGLNRVRFLTPVRVGSRIRGRTTLQQVVDLGGGAATLTLDTTIEIDGGERPALVAQAIHRVSFPGASTPAVSVQGRPHHVG